MFPMSVSDIKPPSASHDDAVKQLRHEADALSARILLKLLADPARKQKLLAVTHQVLVEESGKGFMKRLYAGSTLSLLSGLINSLARNVTPESPAPDIGRLLTTCLQIINHQTEAKSPAAEEATTRRITETIDAFLANMDFGELNQAVAESHDQLILLGESLADMLQDNHLGKLASLGPAAVSATNLLTAALNRFLRHIHDSPPDFVAGFLAGLIELLDADALAEFLNHKNELVRMLYVGNLLQGDGKTSVLETAITSKSREVLGNVDPDIFCKKETGTAELTATVNKSLRRAMADYPEFLQKVIANRTLSVNARIRSLQTTLTLLLDLPEEALAQSLATAIAALNTYELSETFGSTLTLLKTVHEHQPGALGKWLTDIVKTLDSDDLAEVTTILMQETVDAIKPLAATVMPPLISGLGELLAASLKEAPETTAPSLSRLFDILKTSGETS